MRSLSNYYIYEAINILHFLNRIYYYYFFFHKYKKCFYNIMTNDEKRWNTNDGLCDLLKRK